MINYKGTILLLGIILILTACGGNNSEITTDGVRGIELGMSTKEVIDREKEYGIDVSENLLIDGRGGMLVYETDKAFGEQTRIEYTFNHSDELNSFEYEVLNANESEINNVLKQLKEIFGEPTFEEGAYFWETETRSIFFFEEENNFGLNYDVE